MALILGVNKKQLCWNIKQISNFLCTKDYSYGKTSGETYLCENPPVLLDSLENPWVKVVMTNTKRILILMNKL